LQATGQKPAGLNSGAAQREYQDIQSKRFAEKSKRYDKFVLNCAKQTVECAKELAAAGNYKIRAVSRKSIEYIDWGEINLAETDYAIELLPTSSIPSTVSGKMEWAEDMSRIGQIPPEDMMEILDFPDIERYAKLANADRNVINRNIAHMLKTGEVVTPEPYDNHPLALKLCSRITTLGDWTAHRRTACSSFEITWMQPLRIWSPPLSLLRQKGHRWALQWNRLPVRR